MPNSSDSEIVPTPTWLSDDFFLGLLLGILLVTMMLILNLWRLRLID